MAQRSSLHRTFRLAVPATCSLALAIGLLLVSRATAAECTNMPPSRLELYDIKTPPVDEHAVNADELDRLRSSAPASSFHTMMLTTHDVAVILQIAHRIIPVAGGMVCDSPELVRIAVGFPKRTAYLAQQAERDSCLRAALLDHEAEHRRADAAALTRLLNAKQETISASVAALKRIALPGPDAAVAQWEAGLRTVLDSVKQEFLAEERQVNATVDTPDALRRIENACGGKLKSIETEAPRDL
jgi:hypothetical protein